jgi:flagellar protein FliS
MMTAYATAQYQEMQVQTSPERLVVMAYDGALRFLNLGLDAMRRGDRVSQGVNLGKAQRIIVELSNTLDMRAGDIALQLDRVYRYLLTQLLHANADDKPEPVEEVIGLMSGLRDSWAQAEQQLRSGEQALAGVAR